MTLPMSVQTINTRERYYRSFQNYYNCHSYMDMTPYYYTDVRLKVHHWQLRDMLLVDETTGMAYYNYENQMRSLDLNQPLNLRGPVELNLEVQLDFHPRCFKQSNGIMVLGGLMASGSKSQLHLISTSHTNRPIDRSRHNSYYQITNNHQDSINNGGLGLDPTKSYDEANSPNTNTGELNPFPISSSSSPGAAAAVDSPLSPLYYSSSSPPKTTKSSTPNESNSSIMTSFAAYRTRSPLGIFLFHNSHINQTQTVVLGDMINNSVAIYPKRNSVLNFPAFFPNQYVSYVCNNDLNLYSVDVSGSHIALDRKIQCEPGTALNNAELNPITDKLLAITGDLLLVFLVDPSSERLCISTIKTSCDSGFGISFDPSGYLLATTYQDGTCLIFDIRNLPKKNKTLTDVQPLHSFKLTRAGHQLGAFRCCKFLDTGRDNLLVVSEHVGRVHVVDLARNLEEQSRNGSSFATHHANNPSLGHQVIVLPYAMDQYGHWMKQREASLIDPSTHYRFLVYNDVENDSHTTTPPSQFPAPLVYDYEYLVSQNPKLFKDFTFQPNNKRLNERPQLPTPDINIPNWNVLALDRMNFDYYNMNSNNGSGDIPIQTTANHVNGEMELSGISWCGEKLAIACDGGGILTWNMNIHLREDPGSFEHI